MAYVTAEYYRNTWKGTFDGTDDELSVLLERASETLDYQCQNRINMNSLSPLTADKVQKATCAQADYINSNGGIEALSDVDSASSVSIGKYSESRSGEGSAFSALSLSPHAEMYLTFTGLLYRGL